MLLFPKEDWGTDSLVRAKRASQTWAELLAATPYSPDARADIARIMEEDDAPTDWIVVKDGPKTDQEKKAILARITHTQYLMHYLGASEEATNYLQRLVAWSVRSRHPGRPGG